MAYRLILLSGTLFLAACGSDIEADTPPSADFTYDCDTFLCTFEATGDNGSQGGNLGFVWTFDGANTQTGQTVVFPFLSTGEHTVTLSVRDSAGMSSTTSKTVTINTADGASYYSLVRTLIGGILQLSDGLPAIKAQGASLQDKILQAGNQTLPLEIDCPVSGKASLNEWDQLGANSISSNDVMSLEIMNCSFDATLAAIDADEGINLVGDFASAEFGIDSALVARGVQAVDYGRYRIGGDFDVTEIAPDRFIVSGERVQFYLFSPADRGSGEIRFLDTDVLIPGNLQGFSGTFSYESSEFEGSWDVVLNPELEFTESNGTISMTSGGILLSLDNLSEIRISVDADPAYLLIEVYQTGEDTPFLTTRLEQRLAITRLSDF